jgi:hypothetical protein
MAVGRVLQHALLIYLILSICFWLYTCSLRGFRPNTFVDYSTSGVTCDQALFYKALFFRLYIYLFIGLIVGYFW